MPSPSSSRAASGRCAAPDPTWTHATAGPPRTRSVRSGAASNATIDPRYGEAYRTEAPLGRTGPRPRSPASSRSWLRQRPFHHRPVDITLAAVDDSIPDAKLRFYAAPFHPGLPSGAPRVGS
ncbi:hypothetical protein Aab01nite_42150 [Paractinoplanes abujensis]|nr:hypothetical protein Aab01nite_42150 [Actinoplanes abujensis]